MFVFRMYGISLPTRPTRVVVLAQSKNAPGASSAAVNSRLAMETMQRGRVVKTGRR